MINCGKKFTLVREIASDVTTASFYSQGAITKIDSIVPSAKPRGLEYHGVYSKGIQATR
jgi:hypothetical protein